MQLIKNGKLKPSKKLLLLSSVIMTSTLILIKSKSLLNSDTIDSKIQDFCSLESNFSDVWGHQRCDNSINLCSVRSERRGWGQRVVSFSLWGDLRSGYWKGIVENLEVLELHYPGWVVRLYVSEDLVGRAALGELCSLHNNYHSLDICLVKSLYDYGRYLPLLDPMVDLMVSRDLDSRLSAREQAAVEEWLTTGLAFHVMRDHPAHGALILAGLWGARMDLPGRREIFQAGMEKMLEDVRRRGRHWYKGLDQSLLRSRIWPLVENQTCVHDSYFCRAYQSHNWRPFPTERETGSFNFVGSVGPMELNKTCPPECRPPTHQDWILC